MKRFLPVLLAFAVGFAVCWAWRDSTDTHLDVTEAQTAFIVESPHDAQSRRSHQFRVIRVRDVKDPQPGDEDLIKSHSGWYLAFNEGRYRVYLEEVTEPLYGLPPE